MHLVQAEGALVEELVPPKQTMRDITVDVGKDDTVPRSVLEEKLNKLKGRGLLDAGLVLVQHGMLQGYLAERELDFGLHSLSHTTSRTSSPSPRVRLLGRWEDYAANAGADVEGVFVGNNGESDDVLDLASFVDRTPLTICRKAPMEYAVEMFGKLGLRHLCVVEEGTGKACWRDHQEGVGCVVGGIKDPLVIST